MIKIILTLNLRYSIVPDTGKKMNCIAAEIQAELWWRMVRGNYCAQRECSSWKRWDGNRSCPMLWGQVSAGEVYRGQVSMWVTGEWV